MKKTIIFLLVFGLVLTGISLIHTQDRGAKRRGTILRALNKQNAEDIAVNGDRMAVIKDDTLYIIGVDEFEVINSGTVLQNIEGKGTPAVKGLAPPLLKWGKTCIYLLQEGVLMKFSVPEITLQDFIELKQEPPGYEEKDTEEMYERNEGGVF